MRLWVHVIWLKKNPGTTLMTCGPKEDKKLEALIQKWDEETAAYAWWLYVNSEPLAYRLEPAQHVDKYTSPAGHIFARQVEDTASITRFPLSAFLAVSQGFEIQACMQRQMFNEAADQIIATRKEAGKTGPWSDADRDQFERLLRNKAHGDFETVDRIKEAMREVDKAMKASPGNLVKKWGYADRELDEEF